MKNIDIANGLVFKGLSINKDKFDDRLIAQKKIYLLQSLGTQLGYEYNWYVRGPYSPSLTTYLYNNLDALSAANLDKYNITSQASDNIKTVNSLSETPHLSLSDASWYELLASLLYMLKNKAGWNLKDNESVFLKLIEIKPQYNIKQCEDAYQILKDKGFINN